MWNSRLPGSLASVVIKASLKLMARLPDQINNSSRQEDSLTMVALILSFVDSIVDVVQWH